MERLSANYGLWVGSLNRGEAGPARAIADVVLRDIEGKPPSPETAMAHRLAGTTEWYLGNFDRAVNDCCSVGGIVCATLLAALQQQPRHLLDEQRYAAGARGDILHHVARQRMAGGELRHHVAHLGAVERRE
jgi:hypothetical protein